MKLLMCLECQGIFNLQWQEKSCPCGKTSGRYVTERQAEVAGPHVAIAIGTGSLESAVMVCHQERFDWREDHRYGRAMKLFNELRELVPTVLVAWVRAPEGLTNQNTKKVNK